VRAAREQLLGLVVILLVILALILLRWGSVISWGAR